MAPCPILNRVKNYVGSSRYLVSRGSLSDDDVSRVLDHGHPIGVEQLPVALAALAELELEPALLVEDL